MTDEDKVPIKPVIKRFKLALVDMRGHPCLANYIKIRQ